MTSGPTSHDATRAGATDRPDPTVAWRRADDALWRVVPGSLVALGPGAEAKPQLIIGPAVEAWSLLEQPQTTEHLTAALAEQYQVATETIVDDVARLVADLAHHGLVAGAAGRLEPPAADEP